MFGKVSAAAKEGKGEPLSWVVTELKSLREAEDVVDGERKINILASFFDDEEGEEDGKKAVGGGKNGKGKKKMKKKKKKFVEDDSD